MKLSVRQNFLATPMPITCALWVKKGYTYQKIMKTILSLTKTDWYSDVSHSNTEKNEETQLLNHYMWGPVPGKLYVQ